MTTEVISAAEAWEEVERLKIAVSWNEIRKQWSAIHQGKYEIGWGNAWVLGWGPTPLEAVASLLARIGEAANKAETENA